MKRIVFVKDMKNEEDLKQIKAELDNTRLKFKINLMNKTVTIEGDNDELYAAKQAIAQAGYTVM